MSDMGSHAFEEFTSGRQLAGTIAGLLESGASRRQWHRSRAIQSGTRQGAYEWDFTVAQFIAAAHVKKYHVFELSSPEEQFLEEFVQAVASRRYAAARTLWAGMNEFAGGSKHAATSRPLLRRLRELAPQIDPAGALATIAPMTE
ncbi:hypothetical protein [Microbacterium sp.]|uniref:hypothetical protein n=1 Tax=Microbacterium sp. TaxID=51671 RepID=UPI003566523C